MRGWGGGAEGRRRGREVGGGGIGEVLDHGRARVRSEVDCRAREGLEWLKERGSGGWGWEGRGFDRRQTGKVKESLHVTEYRHS